MPDAQLAQEVQNPRGLVPSWMALSELTKRQQERQAAPVQVPQGTVAGEVLNSLRASGMQPGMNPGMAPQSQGIAPGYCRGGIIGMAAGGAVGDGILGGLTPELSPLDPAKYQLQYEAPAHMGLDEASNAMRSIYGSGQDYSPLMQQLSQLEQQGQVKPHSKWDTLRDFGFRMAANGGDPLSAIGSAFLGEKQEQAAQKQLGLQNAEKIAAMKAAVMQQQQSRQDHLADATRMYQDANNQMNDSVAARKLMTGQANMANQRQVDEFNAGLPRMQSQMDEAALKNLANPAVAQATAETLKSQIAKARAAGDVDTVASLTKKLDIVNGTIAAVNEQKKAEQEMKLSSPTQLAMKAAYGDPVAKKAMALIQQQKIAEKQAGQQDITLSPAAMQLLVEKANDTGQPERFPRGPGGKVMAEVYNELAKQHPDVNLALKGADYHANKNSLSTQQTSLDKIAGFEKTIDANLSVFDGATKDLFDSGSPLVNKPWREVQAKLAGDPRLAAYEAARKVVLTEVAKMTNSANANGVLSDSARHEVEHLIPDGASLSQIRSVLNVLRQDVKNRARANDDQVGQIRSRIGVHSSSSDQSAPQSHGVPKIGDTFNGGKVLKITRVD
jgi:hypothetical protein